MQKKEIIWRYILEEARKKPGAAFTQKNIASLFKISTSTVFNAIKIPRQLGAIDVTGRRFFLRDAEKLLMIWATHRNFEKDVVYKTSVAAGAREIEGAMPPDAVFGAYSAYRLKYDEAPADYSAVYAYCDNLEEIKKRFPPKKGDVNLTVLKKDPFINAFGGTTSDTHTFVDLWNLPQWYAKDYRAALKEKLNF